MTTRERSREIFQEAKSLIPGGVNSPARAFGAVGGEPIVMARGKGACLFDVDDNCYIDYVLSWGPMILGHTHPQVTAVLEDAIRKGTSFGTPTENENRLAKLVISLVPSIEKIRLVNSGTEATMSAIRLARGYTGRNKIVKFIGNYHGHVDSLLVAAGSSAATLSVPNSPGVTMGTTGDTILLPYNDVSSLRSLFAQQGSEIAAVIVEPVAGNMGCVPGSLEFLQALREETQKTATVLIFDEVMSGFRVARGGALERFGIIPDLTTLGKVIGGGLPVGAYGGRTEIMDHVLPQGKVFQAGTLSGNPLATAAGIATLSVIANDPLFYDKLEQKTNFLADGLLELGRKNGVKLSVGRCGSMMTLFFPSDRDDVITDWTTASRCDTKRFARYFWNMLNRGIYLPCSQFETMFLSIAHSDEMLQQTLDAADQAFRLDR